MKKKEQSMKIDSLLLKLCHGSDPLGIVGLRNSLCERNSLVFEELRRNGVKLFLMCQANTNETITDCSAMKFFQDFAEPFYVTGQTDRQVEVSLKNCLKLAVDRRLGEQAITTERHKVTVTQRNMSKTTRRNYKVSDNHSDDGANKYDILTIDEKNVVQVTGGTLQIILQDETLSKVFLMLCSMCSLCVGSSINAYQKRDLTRALRDFAI